MRTKKTIFFEKYFLSPLFERFSNFASVLLLSNHFRDNLLYILLKDIAE